MLKRMLSGVMAVAMAVALTVPVIPAAATPAENTPADAVSAANAPAAGASAPASGSGREAPSDYEPPAFEEGKIHLNGYVAVASDGQLVQELQWTYPFANPMRPENPDPGRPYKYRIWQSKKQANGTWSAWDTRSPVDTDKSDGQVRVLNVYPSGSNAAQLQNWLNQTAVDASGKTMTIGRGIISVKAVSFAEFKSNAEAILKTDADGNLTDDYQYSVIFFGTWDANSNEDLNEASYNATVAFSRAGGGLFFGHDTVVSSSVGVGSRTWLEPFAGPDFLDMTLTSTGVQYTSAYVKVVDTGFLTSRPWNLEGATLNIPSSHVLGQKANGSKNRVWMQFSDSSGNVLGGTAMSPGLNKDTDNLYLVTKGSNAFIQTGHSNGSATVDEAKVIANTLIYLAQSTTTTTGRDISFVDEAAPDAAATAAVSGVAVASDGRTYTASIDVAGAVDHGTDYAYRIQALPQITLDNDSDYVELWSSTATDPTDSSLLHQTATSGLRGYHVAAVDTSATAMAAPKTVAADKIVTAVGGKATVPTPTLNTGTQYYAHVFAVDWAGNVSADHVVPVSVSAKEVRFHANDGRPGDDVVYSTLVTGDGTAAGWAADPVREGHLFLGWKAAADGSGDVVERSFAFGTDNADPVDLYACWVRAWNVDTAQTGSGEVVAAGPDGSAPFAEGQDVTVRWAPAAGWRVGAVWLDGVAVEDPSSGSLTLPAIKADHQVAVEFERVPSASEAERVLFNVDTWIEGAPGAAITPSASVDSRSPQARDYRVSWSVPAGYRVASVAVNGIEHPELAAAGGVTFPIVDRDWRVAVRLERGSDGTPAPGGKMLQVQTEVAGGPGTISPSMLVAEGGDYAVEATADDPANYEVESVKVYGADGAELTSFDTGFDGASAHANLTHIRQNLRVVVRLAPKKVSGTVTIPEEELVRVDTSREGAGSISGSRVMQRGESYRVEWKADEGWTLASVAVDGRHVYYPQDVEAARAMALEAGESGSIEIGSPGAFSFSDVQSDRTIHVTFKKADEQAEEGLFPVRTQISGGPGSITAGNGSVAAGSDYPVQWTVPDGYEVTRVTVNGEERPDLLEAGRLDIEDIDRAWTVAVTVGKVGAAEPRLAKRVENGTRADGNRVGDVLTYAIEATNARAHSVWENAVIRDRIPAGLTVDLPSIRLTKPNGETVPVAATCYDEATRELSVPVGALAGRETCTVTFTATVNRDALRPGTADLTNVAFTSDNEGNPRESDPARPNDDAGARPEGAPAPRVTKEASILAEGAEKVQVGDRIRYTLTAANDAAGSVWAGVILRDEVPEGLAVDAESIELVAADGSRTPVSPSAWDAGSRVLAVFAGDVIGGEEVSVVFEATVEESAVGRDIGNQVTAAGGLATDEGRPGHWGTPDDYVVQPGDAAHDVELGLEYGEDGSGEASSSGTSLTVTSKKSYPDGKTEVVEKDGARPDPADGPVKRALHRLAQTGDRGAVAAFMAASCALGAGALLLTLRSARRRRDGR